MKKQCNLWFCDYDHYAKGLCQKHYQAKLRHGTPLSPNQEDILRANNMISLGRQILAEIIPYLEDESLLQLSKTFLDNTNEDYKQESNLPPCEFCGKHPQLLTDGKTFVMKICECQNEPTPIENVNF